MSKQSRGYVHRVDIRADLHDVWQALIDPAILARWQAPNAFVDAREGGRYCIRLVDAKLTREAHIDIYQPPRRLRLIYMPPPQLPDEGAVLVDDFLIDQDDAASRRLGCSVTILRLMGSGIPEGRSWDAMYARLRTGWERALLRLKVSFEKKDEPAPEIAKPQTTKAAPEFKLLEWPEPTKKKTR
jgi:uncharacterized protein YndB with AHSA1/START domain